MRLLSSIKPLAALKDDLLKLLKKPNEVESSTLGSLQY